jgi:RNA polymerase sigma factor (sigma-70 family)
MFFDRRVQEIANAAFFTPMSEDTTISHTAAHGANPRASQPGLRAVSHDWVSVVNGIQAGNEAGILELYRILNRGIRYYLLRQTGCEDLEDRLHEVFLIVVSAIENGEMREPDKIMGFVRTVARRQVASHIEQMVRKRQRESELTQHLTVVDPRRSPEELATILQKVELMSAVLVQMPERQREVLQRFYLHEQAPEQICQEMSLTENQFRLMKSQAKAAFGAKGQSAIRKPVAPASTVPSQRCA